MSDDIEFLKDQIKRLNLVLAKHQGGLEKQDEKSVRDIPFPPWMTDRNHLSPLLKEYDKIIDELSQTLQREQNLLSQVTKENELSRQENRRLLDEIQAFTTSKQSRPSYEDITSTRITPAQMSTLKEQYAESIKEKDATFELWQAAVKEIDRLEGEIRNLKENPLAKVLEEQTLQLQEQYQVTVSGLNTQLEEIREHNRKLNDELFELKLENDALRKKAETSGNATRVAHLLSTSGISDVPQLIKDKEEMIWKMKRMQKDLEQWRKREESWDFESKEFARLINELKGKCSRLEEDAYASANQVKESIQTIENLVLEKEQAVLREQKRVEDCERLQQAINKLLDEAGSRTREEVEAVRQQANVNMRRVLEELNIIENERSEALAEVARIKRDKSRLETEWLSVQKKDAERLEVAQQQAEEWTRRALRAEGERDEMRRRYEASKSGQEKEQSKHRSAEEHLRQEILQLQERITTLNAACEKAQGESQRLATLVEESQSRLIQVKKEAERMNRKSQQQMSLMEQAHQLKEKELESRIRLTDDNGRRQTEELRNMLSMQNKITQRWKDECHNLTEKSETKVTQLREEINQVKKRKTELETLLNSMQMQCSESEQMLQEETRHRSMLEDRIKTLERRLTLSDSSGKVEYKLAQHRKKNGFHSDEQIAD